MTPRSPPCTNATKVLGFHVFFLNEVLIGCSNLVFRQSAENFNTKLPAVASPFSLPSIFMDEKKRRGTALNLLSSLPTNDRVFRTVKLERGTRYSIVLKFVF